MSNDASGTKASDNLALNAKKLSASASEFVPTWSKQVGNIFTFYLVFCFNRCTVSQPAAVPIPQQQSFVPVMPYGAVPYGAGYYDYNMAPQYVPMQYMMPGQPMDGYGINQRPANKMTYQNNKTQPIGEKSAIALQLPAEKLSTETSATVAVDVPPLESPPVMIQFGESSPVKLDVPAVPATVVPEKKTVWGKDTTLAAVTAPPAPKTVAMKLAALVPGAIPAAVLATKPVAAPEAPLKKVEEVIPVKSDVASEEKLATTVSILDTKPNQADVIKATLSTEVTKTVPVPSSQPRFANIQTSFAASSSNPSVPTPVIVSFTKPTSIADSATKKENQKADNWRRPEINVVTDKEPPQRSAPSSTSSSQPSTTQQSHNEWKRGESVLVSMAMLLARKDDIMRYDKAAIIQLYTNGKVTPPELLEFYPEHAKLERSPYLLASVRAKTTSRKGNNGKDEEPHPDELIIFSAENLNKEGVFKHNANLLAGSDADVILRKANLILNKLSVTKFDKLSDEFMAVGLDTPELMEKAVEMIVSKAQMEEHFCFMYANLCRKITDKWSVETEATDRGLALENGSLLGQIFRTRLLTRCQEEFDIDRLKQLEDIRNLDVSHEEKEEKEILLKKRYTGHMRFVGEIFDKGLIASNIMYRCIDELIISSDDDTLVCMVKLMQTIGAKIEAHDKKKVAKAKKSGETYESKIEEFFTKIMDMSESHLSSRIRFMLKDLIDMKKNGWAQRREQEKAKTLDEIRADAAEEIRKVNPHGRPSGSSKGMQGGSQDVRSMSRQDSFGSVSSQSSNDEWSVVQEKGGRSKTKVSTGPALTRTNSDPRANNTPFTHNKGAASPFTSKTTSPRAGSSSTSKPVVAGLKTGSSLANKSTGKPTFGATTSAPTSKLGEQSDSDVEKKLPGWNGEQIGKEIVVKVKSALDEFLTNGVVDDMLLELKELVHPNAMAEVTYSCIRHVLDKNDNSRLQLLDLLKGLASASLLDEKVAATGVVALLNEFDDILLDAPKAGTYISKIISFLVSINVMSLELFVNLPEDNMFCTSPRQADLVASTLANIVEIMSEEECVKMYVESKIKFKSTVRPFPKQSVDDAVAEIVKKYNLSDKILEILLQG